MLLLTISLQGFGMVVMPALHIELHGFVSRNPFRFLKEAGSLHERTASKSVPAAPASAFELFVSCVVLLNWPDSEDYLKEQEVQLALARRGSRS
jgi:hypothetical protein